MAKPDPAGTLLPKPYCSACGHDLTGAVTASACPECGKPLVEVLTRVAPGGRGVGGGGRGYGAYGRPSRRYTSDRQLFGMPLVSIAYGPDDAGKLGHAKGYFAFGDIATGVFAFGGVARGLVAFGGLSLGGVTFGGLSIGTFAAFGGGAVAWLEVQSAASRLDFSRKVAARLAQSRRADLRLVGSRAALRRRACIHGRCVLRPMLRRKRSSTNSNG